MTAISGWQGLWTNENGPANYSLLVNKNPRRNGIRRTVNRESFRVMTALANGLIGAASGSNVTATHKRIAQFPLGIGAEGGVRTIDTITDINRNTAAADVTALKEMLYGVKTAPTTYPTRNPVINPNG